MYAYTDSVFSNRQDMQRLLIKALLCIDKFAAKKSGFFDKNLERPDLRLS
jgi:hypothetical protein